MVLNMLQDDADDFDSVNICVEPPNCSEVTNEDNTEIDGMIDNLYAIQLCAPMHIC